MSVIYGIIHTKDKPVAIAETEALRGNLNQVRFDREGGWQEENAYLGVLLRQLVKNDAEQAPLTDSSLTICADARLDNREELAEKLGIPLESLPCVADSAIILKTYQKWGEDSPAHLLGDFAFAIFDKNRNYVFCARDHIGIRPFYYYWIDGTFSFCTLRPPLMETCPVTPTPNDAFIVAAFIRSHAELSHTVANEIHRLPPAHTLTINAGTLKVQRYWQPESPPLLKLNNAAEYASAMREVFTRAVSCRTRTDHRVGTHLSSGLDSGAITVLAARALREEGKSPLAFSWSPQPEETSPPFGDERDLILQVCQQENIECRFSTLTVADTEKHYRESADIWGQHLHFHEIKHRPTFAAEDCRIMLSGWGGDELSSFDGFRGYLAETLTDKGVLGVVSEMVSLRRNKANSITDMVKELTFPFIPDFLYFRFFGLPIWRQSESLINRNFQGVLEAERQKRSRWHHRKVKTFQKEYLLDGIALERVEQWAERGEICGVNYLYPTLDKRLIEFVLAVPTEQFCQNGWRRYLFRSAMEGILPASVQWNRTKYEKAYHKNVQTIIRFYMKKSPELIAEVENLPTFQRYFERKAVYVMLSKFSHNPKEMKYISGTYFFAKFLDRAFPR